MNLVPSLTRPKPRDLRRNRPLSASLPADTLFVAIYCRVSDPKQAAADKTSLDEQARQSIARVEAIAKRDGKKLVIVGVWKEDFTGASQSTDRPELTKLLNLCHAGQVNLLFAYKLDRLWRDDVEAGIVRRQMSSLSVKIATCDTEYQYDARGDMTDDSRLLYHLHAHFATVERGTILKRSEDGRRGQAIAGKQPIRSQNPYGYHLWKKIEAKFGLCPAGSEGTYQVKEEEAAVIRHIFEMVASGKSTLSVCAYLHENRIPSPTGNATWRPRTVTNILHSPLYKGVARYGAKHKVTDRLRLQDGLKPSYTVQAEPETVTCFPAPVIVTPEVWDAAQKEIAKNRARYSGNVKHRYLLTGFLICPQCGHPMCGSGISKKKQDGSVTRHYMCAKRQADHQLADFDTTERCRQPYIQCAPFEESVAYAFEEVLSSSLHIPGAVRRFKSSLRNRQESDRAEPDARRAALQDEWNRADRAHRATQEAILKTMEADPEADITVFIRRQAEARERRRKAEESMNNLPAMEIVPPSLMLLAGMGEDELTERFRQSVSRVSLILLSKELEIDEKRFVMDGMIHTVRPTTPGKRKYRSPVMWGAEVMLTPEVLATPASSSESRFFYDNVGGVGNSPALVSDTPNLIVPGTELTPLTYPSLIISTTPEREVSCRVSF